MKSIKTTVCGFVLFATILSSLVACHKNDQASDPTTTSFKANFTAAKTSNELADLRTNTKSNIIRSKADFDVLVSQNNKALSKLSKDEIADFRNSIVVREGVGVVGFKYGRIEKLLSYDDFAEVLLMFGMDAKRGFWGFSKDEAVIKIMSDVSSQQINGSLRPATAAVAFEDHKGYYCSVVDIHTCKTNTDSICLSGC